MAATVMGNHKLSGDGWFYEERRDTHGQLVKYAERLPACKVQIPTKHIDERIQ